MQHKFCETVGTRDIQVWDICQAPPHPAIWYYSIVDQPCWERKREEGNQKEGEDYLERAAAAGCFFSCHLCPSSQVVPLLQRRRTTTTTATTLLQSPVRTPSVRRHEHEDKVNRTSTSGLTGQEQEEGGGAEPFPATGAKKTRSRRRKQNSPCVSHRREGDRKRRAQGTEESLLSFTAN